MSSSTSDTAPEYGLPSLLDAQRQYFSSGVTLPIEFRLDALERLASGLEDRRDELLDALASDLGKPKIEAYLAEVYFLISEIRRFLKKLKRWTRPQSVGNPFYFWPAKSEIRLEPLGTSLVVSPWNYPAQLALGPAVASIAAGNTVLLKPSELAPATSSFLKELIGSVFPEEHFSVVTGGVELGKELLEQSFDTWFYTGSEKVGRMYAEAAARDLSPITLELGGKCPCILAEDADLKISAERIAATKFYNAGQTCIAPDFALVPAGKLDEFVSILRETLERFYPEFPSPDLARVVNDSHFERLSNLLSPDAIRIGQDVRESRYFAPTLLPDSTWESPAMEDEIFGPILPILAYEDLEEALKKVAARPSPLALYAFSNEKSTLEKIARAVPSGSVCFNDAIKQATNLKLPFGGVGASGMGRYRGRFGLETFSYKRAYTRRWLCKDLFAVHPPYGDQFEKMKKLLK